MLPVRSYTRRDPCSRRPGLCTHWCCPPSHCCTRKSGTQPSQVTLSFPRGGHPGHSGKPVVSTEAFPDCITLNCPRNGHCQGPASSRCFSGLSASSEGTGSPFSLNCLQMKFPGLGFCRKFALNSTTLLVCLFCGQIGSGFPIF